MLHDATLRRTARGIPDDLAGKDVSSELTYDEIRAIDVGSYLSPDFAHHGIPVCSIPFEGGDTEEVYFRLFDLGFDGFSSDYPSVMFSVIHKLKAKA